MLLDMNGGKNVWFDCGSIVVRYITGLLQVSEGLNGPGKRQGGPNAPSLYVLTLL